jgi:hypothetical protein
MSNRTARLSEGHGVEGVGKRDASEQQGPADVCPDHDAAPSRDTLEPDACREREKEVRHQGCGAQIAHLGGIGIEQEHRGQGQGQVRYLVADE